MLACGSDPLSVITTSHPNVLVGAEQFCIADPVDQHPLIAGCDLVLQAFATSAELAINEVYKKAVSINGLSQTAWQPQCQSICATPQVTSAIAKATACAFAAAFAEAVVVGDPVLTQARAVSCSESLAVSGSLAWTTTCAPITQGCTCSPKSFGYTNLGFESGQFEEDMNAEPPITPGWTIASGFACK